MLSGAGKSPDVIGFGISAIDYLGVLPHFPREDERLRLVESDVQGGGLVGTAMAAAARLGLQAAYAGCVGDDREGEFVLDGLRQEGVDLDFVQVQKGVRTRHSIILVHPEEMTRTILAHGTESPVWRSDQRLIDAVSESRLLYVDGSDSEHAFELADEARRCGVPIMLDADLEKPQTTAMADRADVVVASAGYARWVTGHDDGEKAVQALFDRLDARQVVVTAGSDGAYGIDRADHSTICHQRAFPVAVKDTTGAGDVFHGAYCVGLVRAWSFERTLEFAAAAAALKCRELGGRKGIPTAAEVNEFLAGR